MFFLLLSRNPSVSINIINLWTNLLTVCLRPGKYLSHNIKHKKYFMYTHQETYTHGFLNRYLISVTLLTCSTWLRICKEKKDDRVVTMMMTVHEHEATSIERVEYEALLLLAFLHTTFHKNWTITIRLQFTRLFLIVWVNTSG